MQVLAALDEWQDTGLIVPIGYSLSVVATGMAERSIGAPVPPEGGPIGGTAIPANFPVDLDIAPSYSLVLLLIPEAAPIPDPVSQGGVQLTANVLVPGSAGSYTYSQIESVTDNAGPYKVYARMNDDVPADNSGYWELDVVATISPPVTLTGSGGCDGIASLQWSED